MAKHNSMQYYNDKIQVHVPVSIFIEYTVGDDAEERPYTVRLWAAAGPDHRRIALTKFHPDEDMEIVAGRCLLAL